jgi:hypothetical protein
MDDSAYGSQNQGTTKLLTSCVPGQTIRWKAYAVDLQTPVDIKEISFIGPDGPADPPSEEDGMTMPPSRDWSGIVPATLVSGAPAHYRLTLQMGEGIASLLSTDEPALVRT